MLFVTELIPLGITPLAIMSCLAITGILPAKEVLTGFSNNTTLLVLFMCPIGEALFRTGVCNRIGESIVKFAGKSELRLIGFIMSSAAFLSAFTSNTGTAIVMAPIIISVAKKASTSASTLLMPLAYGASLGGMLTLVGTPPNMIAQDALKGATGSSFSFFDFAKVSLPVVSVAVLYMIFIGKKQIPARLPADAQSKTQVGHRKHKMGIAIIIIVLVVTAMLFENEVSDYGLNLPVIAMIGAILTVVTGCITMDEFTDSIEWTAILLLGGMQPLGLAMQKTGTADVLAEFLTHSIKNPTPFTLTATLIFFSGGLAQFMSHTAATSILAPVCIAMAGKLGVSPAPLLMALCQATSIAIATPIGTPPNVIVYHRGGYKFTDFVVTGIPIFILGGLLLSFLIPKAFPF